AGPGLAGGARAAVEPDGIRARGDGGERTLEVGHAADLDQRPARDIGRIVPNSARTDERPGRRPPGPPGQRQTAGGAPAGSAARTSASPTSAPSKPSARQRATVATSRTPDSAMT